MTQWTERQKRAIEARDCNLLISAGAGSGKTAVLTERIARLITQDRIDADRFVVLTFTKAAASEMKRRIRQALRDAAKGTTDTEYFHRQIQKLEKAQISTIHSFCLNLIKQYYYVIDADPSASVLSDAESLILKQEALETLFDERYEAEDEAFLALADLYSHGNDDAPLKEHIVSLHEFICNRPDPWEWLDNACAIFCADPSVFESSEACRYLLFHVRDSLSEIVRLCEEGLCLCRNSDEDGKRTAYFEEMSDQIGAILHASEQSLRALMQAIDSYTLPRYDMRSFCSQSDEIKTLRSEIKEIYDALKELFGFPYNTLLAQLGALETPMKTLSDAVREYARRYAALKSEKSAVDYSDMEQMCLAILRNDTAAEKVRGSFDYVFVDEYQDTNAIQEEILCRIAGDTNLFAVGDIKQSIYRFREAEPEIFMQRYRRYEECRDTASELVFLTDNFRTQPALIHAINRVFSRIMFAQTGGVDYEPNEKLIPSKAEFSKVKPEIRILELPVGTPSEEEEESDRNGILESIAGLKRQEIEAAHVASLVSELLTQEIFDESSQALRKVQPSDIAIIGRNLKSNASYYTDALKACGIETLTDQSESYYDEIEVSLMINLLQVIDNEKNDLPLLGIMRSFLFGFSEEELLRIRTASPDSLYYHEALCAYADHGSDIPLACKIRNMLVRITEYREMSKHMPIERMMRAIYTDTDILTYAGCLPNGAHRQQNLNELIKLSARYESSTLKGLYHFILYLEKCRQHETAPPAKQNTASEKVRLMTVHKSKGLEFEIVLFVGCANPFLKTELKSDIVCHKTLGICPSYYDMQKFYGCDTILKTAVKVLTEEENKAEEMRILYVGATRAKQRLYFVGTLRSKAISPLFEADCTSEYRIGKANHYLEWLMGGISADREDPLEEIPQLNGVAYENSLWRVSLHQPIPSAAVTDNAASKTECSGITPHKGIYYERVSELLNYRYPHLVSSRIPGKMTVTEIKDSDMLPAGEKTIALQSAPKFAATDPSDRGAKIGTLVHQALMRLDLRELQDNDVKVNLSAQITRMTQNGIFLQEEAELIDVDILRAFFESAVGQELLRADEVHRESAFLMRMPAGEIDREWAQSGETVLVQGVIDCWYRLGEKIVVLDYKTDTAWEESYFDFIKEKYTRQIRLYRKALELSLGRVPDESVICFITMNRYVPVS